MRAQDWIKIAAVAGLVCFAPLGVRAEDKAGAPAVKADQGLPVTAADLARARKMALLNRYFTAMRFDSMMGMMAKSMFPAGTVRAMALQVLVLNQLSQGVDR